MASRQDRRERLKKRMENDAANRDKSNYKPLLDLSDYEDVNWFKAKKGKNEIDILPFEVTTGNDPSGAEIGDDQYKLEYWRHGQVGPKEENVICLLETFGKPCPICEEKKSMMDQGAAWDDPEVKALSAKRRCIYNVIDTNDTDKGVQLFDQSYHFFEKELFGAAEYKDPAFIFFADIEEGYTVTFRGSEETFNKNKFIKPKDFDFEQRDAYPEDIYKEVFPLDAMLIIRPYDEIQALFMGVEVEEKEEPKKEKTTRKKKAEPKAEKEEKPARGRRGKVKEEEPPEDDIDIFNCPAGCMAGKDWDNQPPCKECDDGDYERCGAQYELWKAEEERLEKEAKKEEPKEEPAPTTRRRNKRR